MPNLSNVAKVASTWKNIAIPAAGGIAATAVYDQLAYPKDPNPFGDYRRGLNTVFNLGLTTAGAGMLRHGLKHPGGAAFTGAGIGLLATPPVKDLALMAQKPMHDISHTMDTANRNSNLGLGIGAAAIGLGGLGLAKYMSSKAKQDSPRVKVTLPTRNPKDRETVVELPLDDQSLPPAVRIRMEQQLRRQLRMETRERALKRDPNTNKLIPLAEWERLYKPQDDFQQGGSTLKAASFEDMMFAMDKQADLASAARTAATLTPGVSASVLPDLDGGGSGMSGPMGPASLQGSPEEQAQAVKEEEEKQKKYDEQGNLLQDAQSQGQDLQAKLHQAELEKKHLEQVHAQQVEQMKTEQTSQAAQIQAEAAQATQDAQRQVAEAQHSAEIEKQKASLQIESNKMQNDIMAAAQSAQNPTGVSPALSSQLSGAISSISKLAALGVKFGGLSVAGQPSSISTLAPAPGGAPMGAPKAVTGPGGAAPARPAPVSPAGYDTSTAQPAQMTTPAPMQAAPPLETAPVEPVKTPEITPAAPLQDRAITLPMTGAAPAVVQAPLTNDPLAAYTLKGAAAPKPAPIAPPPTTTGAAGPAQQPAQPPAPQPAAGGVPAASRQQQPAAPAQAPAPITAASPTASSPNPTQTPPAPNPSPQPVVNQQPKITNSIRPGVGAATVAGEAQVPAELNGKVTQEQWVAMPLVQRLGLTRNEQGNASHTKLQAMKQQMAQEQASLADNGLGLGAGMSDEGQRRMENPGADITGNYFGRSDNKNNSRIGNWMRGGANYLASAALGGVGQAVAESSAANAYNKGLAGNLGISDGWVDNKWNRGKNLLGRIGNNLNIFGNQGDIDAEYNRLQAERGKFDAYDKATAAAGTDFNQGLHNFRGSLGLASLAAVPLTGGMSAWASGIGGAGMSAMGAGGRKMNLNQGYGPAPVAPPAMGPGQAPQSMMAGGQSPAFNPFDPSQGTVSPWAQLNKSGAQNVTHIRLKTAALRRMLHKSAAQTFVGPPKPPAVPAGMDADTYTPGSHKIIPGQAPVSMAAMQQNAYRPDMYRDAANAATEYGSNGKNMLFNTVLPMADMGMKMFNLPSLYPQAKQPFEGSEMPAIPQRSAQEVLAGMGVKTP